MRNSSRLLITWFGGMIALSVVLLYVLRTSQEEKAGALLAELRDMHIRRRSNDKPTIQKQAGREADDNEVYQEYMRRYDALVKRHRELMRQGLELRQRLRKMIEELEERIKRQQPLPREEPRNEGPTEVHEKRPIRGIDQPQLIPRSRPERHG